MIVIACTADTQIGMGHLMRSRALADYARDMGQICTIVGPATDYKIVEDDIRFEDWLPYPDFQHWQQSKAEFIADVADQKKARHVIADDYSIDGEGQNLLRQRGLRVLQQYNASDAPHFAANFVVNASPAEHADLYKDQLLRDDIQFLHGPRYAVLRQAFHSVKPQNRERPLKRVLVTFGGGDDRGAIDFVVRHITPCLANDVTLVVMTGAQNPNLPKISSLLRSPDYKAVELQVSPKDVPGLMVSCDMAIMGGGTSVAEAANCGLPMLLTPLVGNQLSQCRGWEALGAAQDLGPFSKLTGIALVDAYQALAHTPHVRAQMATRGLEQMEGQGAKRLLDALLSNNQKEETP